MIKVSFLIIGLLSLLYGAIFLITPFWFVEFSAAQETNIAWLRSIGASIVGLLFLGCLNIYMNPKGKFELLKIITITSILQTLALIYSRFFQEFSAQNLIVIDLTIVIAVLVTAYFIYIALFRKKDFD